MSEHWEHYQTEIEDQPASVLYDHGLSREIDNLGEVSLLWIQVELQQVNTDGFPIGEEWDTLDSIEAECEQWARSHGGVYAGSIATAGSRFIHCYTTAKEEQARSFIDDLMARHNREMAFLLKDDPDKAAYWDDLFPDPEQWRVLNDNKVVQNLIEQGDDLTEPREVTHFLYFTHRELAEECARQAQAAGYHPGEIQAPTTDLPRFCLPVEQEIIPTLEEISRHTLFLEEKANESGGEYDGWETFVLLIDDDQELQ